MWRGEGTLPSVPAAIDVVEVVQLRVVPRWGFVISVAGAAADRVIVVVVVGGGGRVGAVLGEGVGCAGRVAGEAYFGGSPCLVCLGCVLG